MDCKIIPGLRAAAGFAVARKSNSRAVREAGPSATRRMGHAKASGMDSFFSRMKAWSASSTPGSIGGAS